VKTRATPNTIEEVDKEIEELCSKYPSYLRRKVIKAIYAMQVAKEAVKEAEREERYMGSNSKQGSYTISSDSDIIASYHLQKVDILLSH
ncbi:MAG: hypothetical protein QW776_04595, partial [Candidatus Nitrosocaldus sp.]